MLCLTCGHAFPLQADDDQQGICLRLMGRTLELSLQYSIFGSDEEIEIEYNINYCPSCGRNLRKEE